VSDDVAENGMFSRLQFAIVCRRLQVKRRCLERPPKHSQHILPWYMTDMLVIRWSYWLWYYNNISLERLLKHCNHRTDSLTAIKLALKNR